MTHPFPRGVGAAAILGFCLGLTGCSHTPAESSEKHTPAVTVSYPLQREVTDYQDYTGRTAAVGFGPAPGAGHGLSGKNQLQGGCGSRARRRCSTRSTRGRTRPSMTRPRRRSLKTRPTSSWPSRTTSGPSAHSTTRSPRPSPRRSWISTSPSSNRPSRTLEQSRANLDQAQLNLEWTRSARPSPAWPADLLVTRGNLIVGQSNDLDHHRVSGSHVGLLRHGRADRAAGAGTGPPGEVRAGRDEASARSRSTSSWPTRRAFPHEATLDFVNNQLDQATATLLIAGRLPESQAGHRATRLRPEHVCARPRADEPPVPGAAGERRRPWERIRT